MKAGNTKPTKREQHASQSSGFLIPEYHRSFGIMKERRKKGVGGGSIKGII